MILYGCLPSLLFSPSVPEDEFRAYVDHALDVLAPGDAVILGVEGQSIELARALQRLDWEIVVADTDPEQVARLAAAQAAINHPKKAAKQTTKKTTRRKK